VAKSVKNAVFAQLLIKKTSIEAFIYQKKASVLPLPSLMQHPVASALINWYHQNGRELPWRATRDPYYIWLSEIILQQTRVEQGRPYYEKFTATYPDIVSLAKSSEEKVLKLWQGLGYYSRARNLHKAAKKVAAEHKGIFPSDYESIRALPGVGDYTAAAIASFAFDLSYPVVDGNVYRFLSRLFGIETPIDSTQGKKEFLAIAQELIKGAPPHDFNQALMEIGALVCTPKNPDCENCIFQATCVAQKKKLIEQLPVKAKKLKVRNRYFHYIVLRDGNHFYLRQRTNKDIWQQLWEFPLIESKKELKPDALMEAANQFFKTSAAILQGKIIRAKHQLSHQTLHASFYEFTLRRKTAVPEGWKKVSMTTLKKYSVPRLLDRYLSGELKAE
jgi:A/G-specific adenine glycosylase